MAENTSAAPSDLDAEYPYQARPGANTARLAAPVEDSNPVIPPAGRRSEQTLNTVLFAVLCAGFAACDAAIAPLAQAFDQNDWGALCVYASAGAMLAQSGLLAAVLVFAQGPFWRRLAACSCAVAAFWCFWALGYLWACLLRNSSARFNSSDFRFAALSLPLAFLAIQVPLWWLRIYRGWQLTHESNRLRTERPPSIRDYLIGTGIVAVSLSLARIAPGRGLDDAEYWAGWSVFCGSAAAISLVSLPLALWLILEWRRWRLGFALLVFYGGSATAATMAVFRLWWRWAYPYSPGTKLWDEIGAETTFVVFAVAQGMGLMLMRSRGYTLLRSRSLTPRAARQ